MVGRPWLRWLHRHPSHQWRAPVAPPGLGQVGALEGGVCRLALTDADREGRDLVVRWMRELGLTVTVDRIGNVVGLRAGRIEGPPVMTGSHIDTVATGGTTATLVYWLDLS